MLVVVCVVVVGGCVVVGCVVVGWQPSWIGIPPLYKVNPEWRSAEVSGSDVSDAAGSTGGQWFLGSETLQGVVSCPGHVSHPLHSTGCGNSWTSGKSKH